MRHRWLGIGALCAALILPFTAQAQTKIVVGYTAVAGWASAYIADDQGIFAKHGLDVQLLFITLNSTMPQALVSNSIQIGLPTPSVFIQANDAGLDLVALAGTSETDGKNPDVGVMAKTGSGIKTPQDFVGKRRGAGPGCLPSRHVPPLARHQRHRLQQGQIRRDRLSPGTRCAEVRHGGCGGDC